MPRNQEDPFSLEGNSSRRQFWAGIALISVIPILAFCYLQTHDRVGPAAVSACSFVIYLIIFAIGITGYILLRKHPAQIETLRSRLEDTLQQKLPEKALKEAHPNDIAAIEKYLNVLILELESRVGTVEQEKDLLRQKLSEAQKIESLSSLATGVAHDFNNLLAAITGNINIVMRGLPESPARDHAKQADAIAMRAVEMANQLLIYAGRGRLVPEPLNFSAVIRDMTDTLGANLPPGVSLKYYLAEDLPVITADRAQVCQAIVQLVLNAAEAYEGKPGPVVISTGSMRADRAYLSRAFLDMNLPEDTYVYIEVTDRGAGLTPETQSRMFDPFFSTKLRGRGMGLSIVLGVARAHFAAIKIDSEPGKGSTFRLLFQSSRVVIDPL